VSAFVVDVAFGEPLQIALEVVAVDQHDAVGSEVGEHVDHVFGDAGELVSVVCGHEEVHAQLVVVAAAARDHHLAEALVDLDVQRLLVGELGSPEHAERLHA